MARNYFTITSRSAPRWKCNRRRKDVAAAVARGRIKESAAETAAATTFRHATAARRNAKHGHPERRSAVEESRQVTFKLPHRDPSTSLGMTVNWRSYNKRFRSRSNARCATSCLKVSRSVGKKNFSHRAG